MVNSSQRRSMVVKLAENLQLLLEIPKTRFRCLLLLGIWFLFCDCDFGSDWKSATGPSTVIDEIVVINLGGSMVEKYNEFGNGNKIKERNVGQCLTFPTANPISSTPILTEGIIPTRIESPAKDANTNKANIGSTLFATLLKGDTSRKSDNFRTLFTPAGNGEDVAVSKGIVMLNLKTGWKFRDGNKTRTRRGPDPQTRIDWGIPELTGDGDGDGESPNYETGDEADMGIA
ncbi:hypothetical protein Tco_0168355 [Tanacetum coccineum]